jgi:hypothetical protein
MHQAWKLAATRPLRGTNRPAFLALAAASFACLVLAAIRVAHVISFATPLQLVTSGAEEESLAAVWRFAHGQHVYTDPRVIPFTAGYFNWLFYLAYGGAVRLLHLPAAWLPTICRLITLAVTCVGTAILAGLLQRESRCGWPSALLLAALAFFNPLCGFWIVTARPDLGAAVLELAAVSIFLRRWRTGGWLSLLAGALLLEAAWAFKQTSFGALAGIGLSLFFSRGGFPQPAISGRQQAAVLGAIVLAGALTAWAALGPIYRHGLYLSQIHSGFRFSWALLHFGAALVKMPLIAVALGGAALVWRRSDETLRTVTMVLAASFALELAASSKGGAGDYYFLALGIWSVVWIALALDRFHFPWLNAAVVAAGLMQLGAVTLVLAGRGGTIDPRPPGQPYEQLARYLEKRPGPIFVEDTYGDLPWISPTAPHFVVAYNNQADARAGVTFEDGGWQGLIARGYFTTVVTRDERDNLPGDFAARYRLVQVDAGWQYFERR